MLHAPRRRHEGVEQSRPDELTRKINGTLIPKLSKLPGFGGYWVIESEKGVFTSFGLFDTSDQADASPRVAADWVREEKLETTLPNPPMVVDGKIIAHKTTNGIVQV